MADGKKDAKKNDDANSAAPVAADDDAKKKKKKLILLIGLAVLLVAVSIGGTVGAMKLLSPKSDSGEEHSSDSEDADSEGADSEGSDDDENPDEHDNGHAKKGSDKHDASAAVVLPATYFLLQPNFTVNYDVDGKQRFLQAEITLMYRDESVLKTLELHMPAVRNGIVLLLSSQHFPDLQTTEGRENLRAETLKAVQEILLKEQAPSEDKKDSEKSKSKSKSKNKKALPSVEQVLFTQFVMQ
jgi:flagellar protein FliL